MSCVCRKQCALSLTTGRTCVALSSANAVSSGPRREAGNEQQGDQGEKRVLLRGTDMQAGPYKQMRTDINGLGVRTSSLMRILLSRQGQSMLMSWQHLGLFRWPAKHAEGRGGRNDSPLSWSVW